MHKEKLIEIKGKLENSTVISRDFNIPFCTVDRTFENDRPEQFYKPTRFTNTIEHDTQ